MKIEIPTAATRDVSAAAKGTGTGSGRKEQAKGFSEMVSEGMERLNSTIHQADELSEGLAAGKDVDVPDAMIAIAKADISFKMFLQLRNKALSAYEEIMRLQF